MEILKTILCVGFCTSIVCYIALMVSYVIYDTIERSKNKPKD
jgi:hypothetical protein